MTFKKIIILLKNGLELDSDVIDFIHDNAKGSDVRIIAFNDLKKEDLDADLIITLGGDGTFVRAANLIEDSLILGINANPDESEGALTSINIEDLDKLKEILKGKFDIVIKHRAVVKLNGKLLNEYAINEVYLGALSQFHSSRYKIRYNGDEEEHRSSGVIVSTGTGSKAWYVSAGGKPFMHDEEKLAFVVREPYVGERIFKPKILNGDILKGEKIIIESKRDFGGILAINDSTYDFNIGDVAEIELSDKPLKVVVAK